MKVNLFSIPIFIDTVDLEKIEISKADYQPTFLSGVKSNYSHQPQVHPNTYDYLASIIDKNLSQTGNYKNPSIMNVWRNLYNNTDTQEVHIHANSQWSFIIYETVEKSRTVFLNPAWKLVEALYGDNVKEFPVSWRPKVDPGTIIIFPSMLEHYVLAGNSGTTIAGNIHLEYVNE